MSKQAQPPRPLLDWKSRHDPKSRDFPVRTVIGEHVDPRPSMWRAGTVLNQGSEGACVGFAWTGELLASPHRSEAKVSAARGNAFACDLYRDAQRNDDWFGEDYSGTSVLAGAQAVQRRGMVTQYRWAFGIADVRDALIVEGPVVLGVPWYESMYETEAKGRVVVDGEKVGGHAIVLTGYDPDREQLGGGEWFRWRNSWGRGYGVNGNGWVSALDLGALLADSGEACVPVGRLEVKIA